MDARDPPRPAEHSGCQSGTHRRGDRQFAGLATTDGEMGVWGADVRGGTLSVVGPPPV